MPDKKQKCFKPREFVKLNSLGRDAQMGLKDREVWVIETISAVVKPHYVHPELYGLKPPHPFGCISGMFLEPATNADIERQWSIDETVNV